MTKMDDGHTWRGRFNTRATFKRGWFRWRSEIVHSGFDLSIESVSLCPCSMEKQVQWKQFAPPTLNRVGPSEQ